MTDWGKLPKYLDYLSEEEIERMELAGNHEEAKKLLIECAVVLALFHPFSECDACEPGDAYDPEFICGIHQLSIRLLDFLKIDEDTLIKEDDVT